MSAEGPIPSPASCGSKSAGRPCVERADDTDPVERVIVANAGYQLAVVTSLADPEPRPRLIDRCLVAAYDADSIPSSS